MPLHGLQLSRSFAGVLSTYQVGGFSIMHILGHAATQFFVCHDYEQHMPKLALQIQGLGMYLL
jgi:hypothetical protein